MRERCHYCLRGVVTYHERVAFDALLPRDQFYNERHDYLGQVMRVVDHKTPLARGGENRAGNRVIACNDCNCRKGARPYLDFLFETWHKAVAV